MQYLLSEQEYLDLKNAEKIAREKVSEELQTLCTLVADNVPIVRYWDRSGIPDRPLGCILTKKRSCGYCDECPVKDLCPNPAKEWSK